VVLFQDESDQFVAKFRSVFLSENRSVYFTIHNWLLGGNIFAMIARFPHFFNLL
ncbi:hypothetical protein SAMN05443529_1411, partial [Desulfosporosinus hippei DSM 8344]